VLGLELPAFLEQYVRVEAEKSWETCGRLSADPLTVLAGSAS
jgi:hypothetical protein